MNGRHLIVDGMLSGTGIRDASAGGYVDLSSLGLSGALIYRIIEWLSAYEEAHYFQFRKKEEVHKLDAEGIAIALMVQAELPDLSISYFSHAEMRKL